MRLHGVSTLAAAGWRQPLQGPGWGCRGGRSPCRPVTPWLAPACCRRDLNPAESTNPAERAMLTALCGSEAAGALGMWEWAQGGPLLSLRWTRVTRTGAWGRPGWDQEAGPAVSHQRPRSSVRVSVAPGGGGQVFKVPCPLRSCRA